MPPEILIPLVLIGVPAVVVLAKLTGMGKTALLNNADTICERLKREQQDFACEQILIATNKRVALASDGKTGQKGIVFSFGDNTVARLFDQDTAPVIEEQKNGLKLRFADYTLPELTIILDSQEKQAWKDRLAA